MKIIAGTDFQLTKQTDQRERNQQLDKTVLEILRNVEQEGDQALLDYTKKFDKVRLHRLSLSEEEWKEAENLVPETFIQALQTAKANISNFHSGQLEKSWYMYPDHEVMLGQQVTAMDRVGIYIPGGKAAYPSTVLMNAIPAKIAGVKNISITTPPQPDGKVNPYVIVAAKQAGIDTIYKVGGAQAIAAFAYGTESIPKVDKITGPGNDFVARAKKWVYGDVAIDMIAGPSEICVVADHSAPIQFVAADLLSQAEHDEAATALCITFSDTQAQAVQAEVNEQLEQLERKEVAAAALQTNGRIIVVNNVIEAWHLVNEIAPEHLELMVENATEHVANIKHAGAIFLGNYSPEPLGDYTAGPNHTLPTSGTAKFSSPLGVYDFLKKSSIIRYSEQALLKEASAIETLANTEGLTAHANAITLRRKDEA